MILNTIIVSFFRLGFDLPFVFINGRRIDCGGRDKCPAHGLLDQKSEKNISVHRKAKNPLERLSGVMPGACPGRRGSLANDRHTEEKKDGPHDWPPLLFCPA